MEQNYKHFRLATDKDGILWLAIDRAERSANSLSREVFDELGIILNEIQKRPPIGVIITSAKPKGFVAGADISQFTQLSTEKEAFDLIRQAQLILDKLETLPMPTVAMINGFCLGGGLELALACRYRVASDQSDVQIGLPEIKLGIHPGWGGTVRLPNLIGPIEAMKMVLPGATYSAQQCAKLGIIDAVVPVRMLERAAKEFILRQPKPHTPNFIARMCQLPLIRPLLGKLFIKNLTDKKVNSLHYPAPYAVVRNWVKDGAAGDAMEQEAKSIARLMLTGTARNLVRIFFLQEHMKNIAKQIRFKATRVHVIGAGTMGGDIAAWCAYKGMHVTLQDQSPAKIAPAIKRAYQFYQKKLRKPRLIQAVMDRLQPDETGSGVNNADVIIEAVFENLSIKQEIFQWVESHAKREAILATNTSSIPLEQIAEKLKNPERLVGIHFFNPVSKMPLVEIVHSEKTDEHTAQCAAAFVGSISRLPLPVASRAGFLVNRVLMPYLMEAMILFEEGVSPNQIDCAATSFGMPMGPMALADTVGLDICLSVAENLTHYFGGTVPERLRTMVKSGQLGLKSGQGFYQYRNGKPMKSSQSISTSIASNDLIDRMILRMLNEAVSCLAEKVVTDTDLLDAGMIFGTGFAPFLGGPMQYAKIRGISEVVTCLSALAARYGDRFKPHPAWKDLTNFQNRSEMERVIAV